MHTLVSVLGAVFASEGYPFKNIFILIPYDVDENHISTSTDVKPACTFCQFRAFRLGDVLLLTSYT